jgi:hypothetical protein
MNCRRCRGTLKANCIKKTTIGIATELHFCCDSKKCAGKKEITMKAETVPVTSPSYKNSVQVSRFSANWRLILGTQLFGESQKAGEIIASFLDLAPGGFRNPWFTMEEEVALQNEKVTRRIILENLREAIKNISPDENGRVPLIVSFDMGWQKSGRSYNSLSGHAFLIDVRTGRVVGMKVFSKQCLKCCAFSRQGLAVDNYPPHNCSKNYEGSSKGMESSAALQMVKEVFEHDTVRACVTKMVIDDDASTRALLSHSLSELANRVVNYKWPVDSKGNKIPKAKEVGKLPFDHPVITFLADLMHRIRTFGKYVFGLANAPMSTSSCTLVDAYRLKRNFGYWLLSDPRGVLQAGSRGIAY